jgi:type I restriction enzyme R subunit
MYVDRALKDVDCVQTLSRLNRPYPGKRTFILDFINDPENVQAAFEPFYKTTQLANVSDPNQIYEIQNKVDEEGIYRWEEVRAFAKAFFDPSAKQHQLTKHCQPAVDRFRARYRAALEAQQSWSDALEEPKRRGDDNEVNRIEHERKHAGQDKNRLERFRRNLGSFVRFYEFISQIVPYEDRELEQLAVFARYLQPLLSDARIEDGKIDLSDLELTHYRISKQQEHRLRLGEDEEHTTVKAPGPGEGEPRDPEKEELSQIVERLNEMFGADTTEQDKISWFHSVKDKVRENERVMEQVRHNDPDRVLRGDFPRAVEDAVLDSMQGHNHLAQEVLDDDQTRRKFARMLLNQLLRDDSRSDEETARS